MIVEELVHRVAYPSRDVRQDYPEPQGNIEEALQGHNLANNQDRIEHVGPENANHCFHDILLV